ncbi:MAG: 50S ribosomal protein L1 [Actinomycetota bacterium]|nr:50S ribosomal protein L1 [Actinomycetota bacterium]
MSSRGKRYNEALSSFDRSRLYPPAEALELAKQLAGAKFDETIELNMRLALDVRKADQQIRGTLTLPKGTGKQVRVIVFAQGDKAREASEAGADVVGDKDLAERIEKGWTDFDVAIATPDMMPVVGKLGKILGPRGLMPNPKSGTVTNDVGRTVADFKGGKITYRTDRQANVHTVIGKASFPVEDLAENYLTVVDEVIRAKPAAAKGKYLKSLAVSPTMGPGVRIDPNSARRLELATTGAER